LEAGDIPGFGEKMYGSHRGLSSLYEVSCPELNFLVDFTKDLEYVVGSRMMGGGFGGCTINLVETVRKDDFIEAVLKAYFEKFSIQAEIYEVSIIDGTKSLSGDLE
jgi:galactokinase